MKKIILVALLAVGFSFGGFAQQDAMYTQFNFNKLAINPAYAGSREAISLTLLYRDQWTGLEGAPKTGTFTIHSPLKNDKIALGLQVINDRHGVINETGLWTQYAYRMPIKNGKLAIGLNAGLSNYRANFADAVVIDETDPVIMSNENLYLPNFGAGIYYYSEKWFAGVSVPHILANKLSSASGTGATLEAQRYTHLFAMAGYVFNLGANLKARPSIMIKYSQNAPVGFDGNLSFLIKDRLWLGASYRYKGSVDFNIEYNITQQFRIGYAYDYVLNEISDHTKGSHEILLGFDFNFEKSKIVTPRNIIPRYF